MQIIFKTIDILWLRFKVYSLSLLQVEDEKVGKSAALVKEMQLVTRHCNQEEQNRVFKAVQDNGFMAHHESVLLAMLGSEDEAERMEGVRLIFNIRKLGEQKWPKKSHGIRPVQVRLILRKLFCVDWNVSDP